MSQQAAKPGRFLGSLKDALAAASRDDTQRGSAPTSAEPTTQLAPKADAPKAAPAAEPAKADAAAPAAAPAGGGLSAAEAAREVKGQTSLKPQDKHVEFGAPPTTRVVRGGPPKVEADSPRTQLVRGKVQVKRGAFEQDPVVGWLVIVGGAGMGAYRPIFEGNNTVGRAATQRIPLDFGDDSISSSDSELSTTFFLDTLA